MEKDKLIKLHLGCGEKHLDGFINVDCRKLSSVDKVCDLRKLNSFKNESVDVIYSSHVFEHFDINEGLVALKEWRRVLKKGGKLFLAVPNLNKIVGRYLLTGRITSIIEPLLGAQDYKENLHKSVYNFNLLKIKLKEAGFGEIRLAKFDFLPDNFDDSSSHWSSLNVVAVK